MCFEQISIYRIGIHAMLCKGQKTTMDISDSDDDDNKVLVEIDVDEPCVKGNVGDSVVGVDGTNGAGGALLMDAQESFVECPICSDIIASSTAEIHVNSCLDGS